MSITLFCLIKGNTIANAFSVKINRDEPISELKKAIKAEKQNDFAGVDADKLKLWKVEISDERDDILGNLLLQDEHKLPATREIGEYWAEKPPKRHIHVIVSPPETTTGKCLSMFYLSNKKFVVTKYQFGHEYLCFSFLLLIVKPAQKTHSRYRRATWCYW